jgi:hypothetical protein
LRSRYGREIERLPSDYEQGLLLGEAVALSVLRDQATNYAGENFSGFAITRFDGTSFTV